MNRIILWPDTHQIVRVGTPRITSVALILSSLLLTFSSLVGRAAEARLTSPDGKLAVVVTDTNGLRYRVEVDGNPVVTESRLGLEFLDGTRFGPAAIVTKTRKITAMIRGRTTLASAVSSVTAGRNCN